jgi:hypothetical protein
VEALTSSELGPRGICHAISAMENSTGVAFFAAERLPHHHFV